MREVRFCEEVHLIFYTLAKQKIGESRPVQGSPISMSDSGLVTSTGGRWLPGDGRPRWRWDTRD